MFFAAKNTKNTEGAGDTLRSLRLRKEMRNVQMWKQPMPIFSSQFRFKYGRQAAGYWWVDAYGRLCRLVM